MLKPHILHLQKVMLATQNWILGWLVTSQNEASRNMECFIKEMHKGPETLQLIITEWLKAPVAMKKLLSVGEVIKVMEISWGLHWIITLWMHHFSHCLIILRLIDSRNHQASRCKSCWIHWCKQSASKSTCHALFEKCWKGILVSFPNKIPIHCLVQHIA